MSSPHGLQGVVTRWFTDQMGDGLERKCQRASKMGVGGEGEEWDEHRASKSGVGGEPGDGVQVVEAVAGRRMPGDGRTFARAKKAGLDCGEGVLGAKAEAGA